MAENEQQQSQGPKKSVSYESRSFLDHLLIICFTWGFGYLCYGCKKKKVTRNY